MPRNLNPVDATFWPRRVLTLAEAAKFINAAGFCLLFPVNTIPLPSLYYATTRRSLFEDWVWDKYSDLVWRWKDELPRRKKAFYAKCFRARGTLISLEQLPNFLALRESALDPSDHEHFYASGRIRADARIVWEALDEHGPLATLELRHACKMETKTGNIRFKRAILDLQRLLVAVHSGAEQETGAWPSARFDLTCRAFPKQTATARELTAEKARQRLAAKFIEHRPDAKPLELARLFGWSNAHAVASMEFMKSP